MSRHDPLAKARRALAAKRAADRRAREREARLQRRQRQQHTERLRREGEARLGMFVAEGLRDAKAIRETGRDTRGRVWT